MSEKQQIIDKLIAIAKTAAENSGGKLKFVFNEEDDTADKTTEASHFFKFKGKRLGRDIEMYGFMCEVAGNDFALAEFAQAMGMIKAVGLHDSWEAVRHDCANLSEFISKDNVSAWRDLFSIPSPKKADDE